MSFQRHSTHTRAVFFALLALAALLAALAYLRGLHGVFLFDDFANLPVLGATGPIDNWPAFWRYITSGTADPTGRPLTMLSFLIDARNWPTDPYPFKRTSLILHLLNGFLLALLLRRLGQILHGKSLRIDVSAALGAAFWLLHPLFVSTTLYVVQREAMLPATFVLLGLIGWCKGRESVAQGRASGLWLSAISIIACTALALASKANGALLPLLCWLMDGIVLAPALPIAQASLRHRFAWMRRTVLILPSIILLAWLAEQGLYFSVHGVPAFRPWTFGERLLTEARIVCDYLTLLWLPHPYTAGLFNDAFQVSTSLVSPPGTLAATVFLAALLAGAVALRKRTPALALAILFYFAAQLLESTVIPLELYYEHRNYLPALLMFWPLALWLTDTGHAVSVRRTLIVMLPLLLAGMTYLRADLWGNAQLQAEMWAEKNPASPRAQAYAAAAERARGRPDLAVARLRGVHVSADDDIQIALNLVGAECEQGRVAPADIARADAALRNARITGQLGYDWFGDAITRIAVGKTCAGLDAATIRRLLDAASANPNAQDSAGRRQDNLSLRGSLALALHDPDSALAYFNRALDAKPDPGAALNQAAQLGAAGYPRQGLVELDHLQTVWKSDQYNGGWSMATLHAWVLMRQGYWQNEIAHLRHALQQDVPPNQPAT
ncbi:MAG: tetratricopeptide repeat protein [Xanthomonadaceae bacterium]|nr:tetratricopeptide repeat protein [Xanthomonadaceae bacterium]MDE2258085.1 tetratricopeptide repeat protein [Xanthomonadaceae bacterium]